MLRARRSTSRMLMYMVPSCRRCGSVRPRALPGASSSVSRPRRAAGAARLRRLERRLDPLVDGLMDGEDGLEAEDAEDLAHRGRGIDQLQAAAELAHLVLGIDEHA